MTNIAVIKPMKSEVRANDIIMEWNISHNLLTKKLYFPQPDTVNSKHKYLETVLL